MLESNTILVNIVLGLVSGICSFIAGNLWSIKKLQEKQSADINAAFIKLRTIEDQLYANDPAEPTETNAPDMPNTDLCKQSDCPYTKSGIQKDNQ